MPDEVEAVAQRGLSSCPNRTRSCAAGFVAALLWSCGWAALPGARAGVVNFVSGELSVQVGEDAAQVFPATLPGSDSRSLSGGFPFGEVSASYAVSNTAEGAVIESTITGDGGSVGRFATSFSIDRPHRYVFFADPQPTGLTATLDDVLANAFFDPFEVGFGGNLVQIDPETGQAIGFEAKTFEGTLGAGTHTFSLVSGGGIDRGTPITGGGFARVTLTAAAIPLPPAVWTGLPVGALAIVAARALVTTRRERRA